MSHLAEPLLLRCYVMCVVPSLKSVVFCTRVASVCFQLCKEEGSSLLSLQLLRGGGYGPV